MEHTFNRVLLKLSGEALAGEQERGINMQVVQRTANIIAQCHKLGVQIAGVIGGGNFWRGRSSGDMERTCADKIGMLATVMNSLALGDALNAAGVPNRVMSALVMPQIADVYTRDAAVRHLNEGKVVILSCGTGNPYFSTDSTSALRGLELNCDVFFKGTMVDGVYDKDPHRYPDAKKYHTLTFTQMLEQELGVMDLTAAVLCKDNHLPVYVFDMTDPQNIVRAVTGEDIGTLVREN